MNECQKIHPLLAQYLEGDLSSKEKRLVAWHLNQCAEARRELHQAEQLRKRLMELPEPAFPSRLHDRILNGVYRPHMLEEERKAEKAAVRRKEFSLGAILRRPVWGLAAAAVFAFVFFALNPDWIRQIRLQRPSFLDPGRAMSGSGDPDSREAPVQGFPDEPEPAGAVPGAEDDARSQEAARVREEASALAEQEARDAREQALLALNAEKKAAAPAPAAVPKAAAPKPVAPKAVGAKAAVKRTAKESAPPADTGSAEVLKLLQASGKAKGETAAPEVMGMAAFDASAVNQAPIPVTTGDLRLDRPEYPRWSGPNARASTTTQEVITESQTLSVYWTLLNPEEPPPAVDFEKQAVVVLVAAEKPTAGWRIVLDRADETAMNVVLWFKEEGPALDGVVAQVITRPWALQVIDKPMKPVVFKKRD